jgi:hypothetical protein
VSGGGGGTETTTPAETAKLVEATKLAEAVAGTGPAPSGAGTSAPAAPKAGNVVGKHGTRRAPTRRHRRHHSSPRRPLARPALPHRRGSFTG